MNKASFRIALELKNPSLKPMNASSNNALSNTIWRRTWLYRSLTFKRKLHDKHSSWCVSPSGPRVHSHVLIAYKHQTIVKNPRGAWLFKGTRAEHYRATGNSAQSADWLRLVAQPCGAPRAWLSEQAPPLLLLLLQQSLFKHVDGCRLPKRFLSFVLWVLHQL